MTLDEFISQKIIVYSYTFDQLTLIHHTFSHSDDKEFNFDPFCFQLKIGHTILYRMTMRIYEWPTTTKFSDNLFWLVGWLVVNGKNSGNLIYNKKNSVI